MLRTVKWRLIAAVLARLSTGDLTVRIDTPIAPAYEKLRSDFNVALAQLQQTMTGIVNPTFGLRASSEEITHASDDLSKRTEQQAASLEKTDAALDQITAAVRRTADGAKEAKRIAASASTEEQATRRQQVNSPINQMDQVSQQNAAMVEQATAAGYALREETDGLSRMMGEFKVGDQVMHRARRFKAPMRWGRAPPDARPPLRSRF